MLIFLYFLMFCGNKKLQNQALQEESLIVGASDPH